MRNVSLYLDSHITISLIGQEIYFDLNRRVRLPTLKVGYPEEEGKDQYSRKVIIFHMEKKSIALQGRPEKKMAKL